MKWIPLLPSTARARPFCLLVIALLLLTLSGSSIALAQDPSPPTDTPSIAMETELSPTSIDVTLEAGQCTTESIVLSTGQAALPQLDVLFIVDATISMVEELIFLRSDMPDILLGIQEIAPDSRFALGTVADYPGIDRSSDIQPWELLQDFTTDADEMQTAVNTISLYDSGDTGEAYLRALDEARQLTWRPQAQRFIVFIGDAPPINPDVGPDGVAGTADDLPMGQVLDGLLSENITLISAYTNYAFFFEMAATRTQGVAFELEDGEQIPAALPPLLENYTPRLNEVSLTASPSESLDEWLSWQPEGYTNVGSLQEKPFTLTLCVPPGTPGRDFALYTFDINVMADGVTLAVIPANITVLPRADLNLSQSLSANPTPGGADFIYTLNIANQGPDPAQNVLLNYSVPAGLNLFRTTPDLNNCALADEGPVCNLGTLGVDEVFTVQFISQPNTQGRFDLAASVTADEPDPNPSQNSVAETVTVDEAVALSLSQSGFGGDFVAGETVGYQVVVRNDGLSPATDLELRNELPANADLLSATPSQGNCRSADTVLICNFGDLSGGQTALVDVEIQPNQGGQFENAVVATSNEASTSLAPSDDETALTIEALADLSLGLTEQPSGSYRMGQPLEYSLVLTNQGPSAASRFTVFAPIPPNTEASLTATQGDCQRSETSLLCTMRQLEANGRIFFTLAVTPTATEPLSVTASLIQAEPDPDRSDDAITSRTIEHNPWPSLWVLALFALPFVGLTLFAWASRRDSTQKVRL